MDLLTLSIVLFFVSLFQLIVLGSQYLSNRHIQGLGWWTVGAASLTLVYVGTLFRTHPHFSQYAILLTNMGFLGGLYGYYFGSKQFFNSKYRLYPYLIFFIIYTAVFFYYTLIHDDITIRRIANSVSGVLFSSLTIALFWRQRHSYLNRILFYLLLAFGLDVIFFATRLIVNVIHPDNLLQIENLYLQPAAFMLSSTVGVMITFGLVFVVNQRIRRDYIRSQEQFEHIFNHNPGAILITRMEDGQLINVNKAFSEITGYAKNQIIGKSTLELEIWESPEIRTQFVKLVQENGMCEHFEMKCKIANGQFIFVILSACFIEIDEIKHLLIVATDITKQKQMATELVKSEMLYRLLAENSQDVIWTMDLQGVFTYISPSIEKLSGFSVEEVIGTSWQNMIEVESFPIMASALKNIFLEVDTGHKKGNHYYELRHSTKQGTFVWVESTMMILYNDAGLVLGISGVSRDISERKKNELILAESQQRLAEMSVKDELTSLFNRRKFNEVFEMEFARHIRSKEPFSMIFLDIDYFKGFNDFYGHLKGDECLIRVAQVLAEAGHRATDLVTRYGGEEFAVILPETTPHGAKTVAERIRQNILNLAIPHEKSEILAIVSASLGVITVNCTKYACTADILQKVDELLYTAKRQGRNQCAYYIDPDTELSFKQIVELKWRKSYESGHTIIDTQHKKLFDLANHLLAEQMDNSPKTSVLETLVKIQTHLTLHFQTEEEILWQMHYDGTEEHSQEHRGILSLLQQLIDNYSSDSIGIESISHQIIHQIVLKHLLGADRAFFKFVKE